LSEDEEDSKEVKEDCSCQEVKAFFQEQIE